jgi:hypothetical protein
MSADFAQSQQRRYLKDTATVSKFLAAPENQQILRYYESAVEEFEMKIIAKRKEYQSFDDVMNYLISLLFERDPILRQIAHKRLTRMMLFYMYWNCDIGQTLNAAAQ